MSEMRWTIWHCPDHPHVIWADLPEEGGEAYCFQCDRDVTDDAVEVTVGPLDMANISERESSTNKLGIARGENG